ncbi:MAG: hypothetical protein A2107_01365 [Verrucomicrobia bacterium GWF2_62_7]|nr:MAG: hypothetical protein A2107_01365 [Verrucomicrobia bacterium GWF2_62_7]
MIWVDAQLSPSLADWITAELGEPAQPVRAMGLRDAKDTEIFQAARAANAIVLTKDSDFADLLDQLGPPPSVIWLTCGNTSNAVLRDTLRRALPRALSLLKKGETLVEISQ